MTLDLCGVGEVLQRIRRGFWGPKGRTSCWGRRGFPASGLWWLGFEFPLCGPRPVHSLSAGTSAHVRGC